MIKNKNFIGYSYLKKWQKIAFLKIKDMKYAGILMDYGMGKTLVSLVYAKYNNCKSIIVVSSKPSLEHTWQNEIKKWDFLKYKCEIVKKLSNFDKPADIYLITYDLLRNYIRNGDFFNILQSKKFDLIVLDESTMIKDHSRKRTKALHTISPFIGRRLILAGYIIIESVEDVWSQFYFLDQGQTFETSYYKFINKYFYKKPWDKYRNYIRKGALNKIKEKIKSLCVVMQKDDWMDLPPKRYILKTIAATDQQQILLKKLMKNFYIKIENGDIAYESKYILAILTKYLQIVNGYLRGSDGRIGYIKTPKLDCLKDIVKAIIPANKVLIWCASVIELDMIKHKLKECNPIVVRSSNKDQVNSSLIEKFRSNSDYNILISTIKYLGTSITLTESNYAIYYSNAFSGGLRANSEGRIYRQGQKKKVTYIDIILKDTKEEKVYNLLKRKKDILRHLKDIV